MHSGKVVLHNDAVLDKDTKANFYGKGSGLRLKDQGSRFKDQRSRIKVEGSRFEDQGSRIKSLPPRFLPHESNTLKHLLYSRHAWLTSGIIINIQSRKDSKLNQRLNFTFLKYQNSKPAIGRTKKEEKTKFPFQNSAGKGNFIWNNQSQKMAMDMYE